MRFKPLLIFLFFVISLEFLSAQSSDSSYSAQIVLAEKFYEQKQFVEALKNYESAFRLAKPNYSDLYNAACTSALLKDAKKAFDYINKSIEVGYFDKQWAEMDSDFTAIHQTKEWKLILEAFDDRKYFLENIFASAFKKYDSKNLVPFEENGQVGYIDKKTLSIAIPPILNSFSNIGDCMYVAFKGGIIVNINTQTGMFTGIQYPQRNGEQSIAPPLLPDYDSQITIENSGISHNISNGFSVGDSGVITAYPENFFRHPSTLISDLKENGKFFAIFQDTKTKLFGLMDEVGYSPKDLGFNYKWLSIVNQVSLKNKKWFYFVDSLNKAGFISFDGEKKMYGEFDYLTINSAMPCLIAIFQGKEGLISAETLTWRFLLQDDYTISNYFVTYNGCEKYTQNIKNIIDYYFYVIPKKGAGYLIDINGKKYLPAKN